MIRRHNLGERHESCADTQQWIGNVMREWGHYDEALVCFESALQIKKETLGADHEGALLLCWLRFVVFVADTSMNFDM